MVGATKFVFVDAARPDLLTFCCVCVCHLFVVCVHAEISAVLERKIADPALDVSATIGDAIVRVLMQ